VDPGPGEDRVLCISPSIDRFQNKFLVIPTLDLEKRLVIKDHGKKRIYSFWFHFENSNVWDERITGEIDNALADHSDYSNALHLIEQELVK